MVFKLRPFIFLFLGHSTPIFLTPRSRVVCWSISSSIHFINPLCLLSFLVSVRSVSHWTVSYLNVTHFAQEPEVEEMSEEGESPQPEEQQQPQQKVPPTFTAYPAHAATTTSSAATQRILAKRMSAGQRYILVLMLSIILFQLQKSYFRIGI